MRNVDATKNFLFGMDFLIFGAFSEMAFAGRERNGANSREPTIDKIIDPRFTFIIIRLIQLQNATAKHL